MNFIMFHHPDWQGDKYSSMRPGIEISYDDLLKRSIIAPCSTSPQHRGDGIRLSVQESFAALDRDSWVVLRDDCLVVIPTIQTQVLTHCSRRIRKEIRRWFKDNQH